MPKIIPIRDLKDTNRVAQMCAELSEPIYVTKNGYGSLVIMSIETYDKKMWLQDVAQKISEADDDVKYGRTHDAVKSLHEMRKQHGL